MCAGDLGMYRVMPWAYPPISGGTSGGFSPDGSTSEGGGSGGGSSDPNAIYAKIDGSDLYFDNPTYYIDSENSRRVFQIDAHAGKLGLQNINEVSMIDSFIVMSEIYLDTAPSENAVGSFTTTEYRLTHMPVHDSITRYVTNTTDTNTAAFYRPIQDDSKIVKFVGSIKFVGYDANGNVVRTNTIPMEDYVK